MCKALMPGDEESMSDEAIWETLRTQLRYLPLSKMLDADITDSVIGEGCVIKNCKIFHSVVGLHSCISGGAIIEDTLLMGADYYETEADKSFLAAKGSVPIGIGRNSRIKRAIVDKNARIGENVKILMEMTPSNVKSSSQ